MPTILTCIMYLLNYLLTYSCFRCFSSFSLPLPNIYCERGRRRWRNGSESRHLLYNCYKRLYIYIYNVYKLLAELVSQLRNSIYHVSIYIYTHKKIEKSKIYQLGTSADTNHIYKHRGGGGGGGVGVDPVLLCNSLLIAEIGRKRRIERNTYWNLIDKYLFIQN